MDDVILITELNDFIFCPVSIYFHKLYGNAEKMVYQSTDQIDGTAAHEAIDESRYSSSKDILTGMDVYCEEYRLSGKIDIFDKKKGLLRERKKRIKQIFPGYVYQLYAQCLALREMGYSVRRLELYSLDDQKTYPILLPEEDEPTFKEFDNTVKAMRAFRMEAYSQTNIEKCRHCIYEPACDRSLIE